VTDSLCAKFGDFSFSRFGFIVQTELQRRMADDRCPHATTVGVSNDPLDIGFGFLLLLAQMILRVYSVDPPL